MPFTVPTGFAQSTLHIQSVNLNENEAIMVLGFDLMGGTLSALNTAITSAWTASIQGNQQPLYTFARLTSITATLVDDIRPNIVGGASGGGLNAVADLCVLHKKTSGLRGKHNEGRNYWPGFLDAANLSPNGVIDPTVLATLASDVGNFYSSISGAGFQPVILHKNNSAPTVITGGVLENVAAVQRRRLGR